MSFILLTALVLLEFDGSYRPSPRDPIAKFRSSRHQSIGTASASAALFRSNANSSDRFSEEAKLFAVGAKSLSNTLNSADAEYEGLLMGLEQLEIFLSKDSNVSREKELVIRGDCKAIIDQLNTRSTPRKTEKYYEEATKKIQNVRDCSSIATITFEHVPRENNTLCDALCKLALNISQKRFVASVIESICLGEEEILSNGQNEVTFYNSQKRRINKKSFHPKSKHYQIVMEKILNSSLICQSSKLALACLLSRSAILTNDVAILLQISDFFSQSSRSFAKMYWGDTKDIATAKDKLRSLSIMCELMVLLLVGAEYEAEQLRRKTKLIACEDEDLSEKLNKYLNSILELCINDNGAEAVDDILIPYSNVLTIEPTDGSKYKQQLLEWVVVANDFNNLRLQSGIWSIIDINSNL